MFISACLSRRTPLTDTTMSVAMKTATSATLASLSMCPTHDPFTLRRSCPRRAQFTASTVLSPEFMTFPTDTPLPQQAEPRTNNSRLPNSSRPPSQPPFTPLTPTTAAPPTYLLPTAVPSPATSSLLPSRR